jgi:two-component system sensor histidine kinase KdpD
MDARNAGKVREVGAPFQWRLIILHRYSIAAMAVAVCGLAAWMSDRIGLKDANIAMIFVAGVALVAVRLGRGAAIMAAVLSVLVYDYFFVMPRLTFAVSDLQYLFTLFVMVCIAVLVSELTSKLQAQLATSQEQSRRLAALYQASQKQERLTERLYQMTRKLSQSEGADVLLATAVEEVNEMFGGEAVIYLCRPDSSLELRCGAETAAARDCLNHSAARCAAESLRPAGLGTDILGSASARCVVMRGSPRALGVLCVRPEQSDRFDDPDEQRLLETAASLIALSIQRDQSLADAQRAQMQVQAEQLRNSLLSSVSHDLRTPLAMIAVTASSLLDETGPQNQQSKQEMLQTVVDESNRLSRQVENLLDMARIESGTVSLSCEWEVLEELVGVALNRLRTELKGCTIRVDIPAEFPLVWVADDLFAQVLVNLLENAISYTPAGSCIEISASSHANSIEVVVADNGPGLPRGCESKVFDKFFRGTTIADGQRGIGLGLTICRAIVQAHGGQITARNKATGGAEFLISLPTPICPSDQRIEDGELVPAN